MNKDFQKSIKKIRMDLAVTFQMIYYRKNVMKNILFLNRLQKEILLIKFLMVRIKEIII